MKYLLWLKNLFGFIPKIITAVKDVKHKSAEKKLKKKIDRIQKKLDNTYFKSLLSEQKFREDKEISKAKELELVIDLNEARADHNRLYLEKVGKELARIIDENPYKNDLQKSTNSKGKEPTKEVSAVQGASNR